MGAVGKEGVVCSARARRTVVAVGTAARAGIVDTLTATAIVDPAVIPTPTSITSTHAAAIPTAVTPATATPAAVVPARAHLQAAHARLQPGAGGAPVAVVVVHAKREDGRAEAYSGCVG